MKKFNTIKPNEKIKRSIKPYVTFPLLDKCNLKCKYCGDGGEMSISTLNMFNKTDLFEWHKESRKLGVEKFRITGGEPLLHEDFEEIVHTLAKDANEVLINTNGTLIKKLKHKWINSPRNCSYVVNYHGSNVDSYNETTGTVGNYEELKEGIELLAKEGYLKRLNIVLHQKNIHEIYDVISYCKQLGCDLKIQDVVAVPWQFNEWENIYKDTKELEKEFESKASFIKEHKYAKGFGTPTKIYTIDGVNVTFKSIRNGSHYDLDGVCKDCEFYPCHEGVYDLFVFPDKTSYGCNWTDKSKAPSTSKEDQLKWLIDVFQRSEYVEADSIIKGMKVSTTEL